MNKGVNIKDSYNVEVTFGKGFVGTAVLNKRLLLIDLNKKAKVGGDYDSKDVSGANIVMTFTNEKGLDVILNALKAIKKEFRKKKRK